MTTLAHGPGTTEATDLAFGSVAEAIADGLNSHGFDVHIPGQPGNVFLQVTNVHGASCELAIFGSGEFHWDYRCLDGGRSDPAVLTEMIMCILGGDHLSPERASPECNSQMTLKGQIGRVLAGQGMQVRRDVLDQDASAFEIYSEIAVTNPTHPDRGTVRVADDGLISWHGQMRRLGRPA